MLPKLVSVWLRAEASLTLYLVFRRLVSETGIFKAVLRRRGVTVTSFSEEELAKLTADADAREARHKQLVAQRGIPEKLLRFGLRQVTCSACRLLLNGDVVTVCRYMAEPATMFDNLIAPVCSEAGVHMHCRWGSVF